MGQNTVECAVKKQTPGTEYKGWAISLDMHNKV